MTTPKRGFWDRFIHGSGTRRAITEFRDLAQIERLRLRLDAAEAKNAENADAVNRLAGADALIKNLYSQIEELTLERIDAGSLAQQLAVAEDANETLIAENRALRAELQNLNRHSVALPERDTTMPPEVPAHYEQVLRDRGHTPAPLDGETTQAMSVRTLADAIGGAACQPPL